MNLEVGKMGIFVLQRGWVVVGKVKSKSTTAIVVKDASVIKRWGAPRGLGQLAQSGPTSETILEPSGTVEFHPLAGVLAFHVNEQAWL